MILKAELLKIGSRQTADGATITLKISADDFLPHILVRTRHIPSVVEITYLRSGRDNLV